MNKYYASIRDDSTVYLCSSDDGLNITSIDSKDLNGKTLYDAITGVSVEDENINGIVLSNSDAQMLNLEFIDHR